MRTVRAHYEDLKSGQSLDAGQGLTRGRARRDSSAGYAGAMRPIVRDITPFYSGSRIEFLRGCIRRSWPVARECGTAENRAQSGGVGTNRHIFMRTNDKKIYAACRHDILDAWSKLSSASAIVLLEMSGWSPQTQLGNLLHGVHSRNGRPLSKGNKAHRVLLGSPRGS